jgi:hypothetical protein
VQLGSGGVNPQAGVLLRLLSTYFGLDGAHALVRKEPVEETITVYMALDQIQGISRT